jgi:hypothetical protein
VLQKHGSTDVNLSFLDFRADFLLGFFIFFEFFILFCIIGVVIYIFTSSA